MGRYGRSAALLFGLALSSASAGPPKELGQARRLLESQDASDRIAGVRILQSIDSRDALRLLSSAVRHTLEDIEQRCIVQALSKSQFNRTRAARLLGVTRRTL